MANFRLTLCISQTRTPPVSRHDPEQTAVDNKGSGRGEMNHQEIAVKYGSDRRVK